MNNFLSQVDPAVMQMLLMHSVLRDTALILVGKTLHIENYNPEGLEITQLAPMERIDQILSEPAAASLKSCIETKQPHTIPEELDGVDYELEMFPHRDGALLAFMRSDRKRFDGASRILHVSLIRSLEELLSRDKEISDPETSNAVRKQCLRMLRELRHSELLHEPPQPTEIHLFSTDLCVLCEMVLQSVEKYTGRCIETHLPEKCVALIDRALYQTALYNLLANAIQATPPDKKIILSLREEKETVMTTITDFGKKLDPLLFPELLSYWYRPSSYKNYSQFVAQNARPGFGLSVANCIAQLHGGSLFLSTPKQGGKAVHLNIAKQSPYLQETNLHEANMWFSEYELDELELSVID